MTHSSLWNVCCIVLLPCVVVSAQDVEPTPPPPPNDASTAADAIDPPDSTPRTFVERSSPTTFGATVITGEGSRLLVGNVADNSPADLAGLASGDTIVSINGQIITQPEQFNSYLASHPADPLRIVVLRDGDEQTLVVNPVPKSADVTDARPALGIRFLQANQVILQEVLPGSPAERAGLQPGDRVIALNDTPLASSDHFINLVATAPIEAAMHLVVLRGDDRLTISVTPDAWDVVFDRGSRYTTLRPAFDDATVTVPATNYVGPVYYRACMSPVGVPAIAFPTYYGFPYGYTSWAYPYYPYYGGVYVHPNWYIYAWPGCYGPYPGTRTESTHSESAQRDVSADRKLVEHREHDAQ